MIYFSVYYINYIHTVRRAHSLLKLNLYILELVYLSRSSIVHISNAVNAYLHMYVKDTLRLVKELLTQLVSCQK